MLSTKARWVLALLAISAFINYIDRSNLSVGAISIQGELGLTSEQLGRLLSAFFWTYALMQLSGLSGWLVDRFSVGWIYAIGFMVWTGATALTGVASGFAMFFVLRLALGAGESVAYPAYSRILATYPERNRGLANALIDAGTKAGPALGTLLGGLLMAKYGWRAFFIGLGLGSLIWLIPWLFLMPRGEAAPARESDGTAPTIRDILRQRSAWFSFLGLFCSNYFWYFMVTWLPAYLEKERAFPKEKMAVLGSLAFLTVAVSTVFCGWLADRWISRGGTPTRVRKTFAGLGLTFSTIVLPVSLLRDDVAAMTLLLMACAAYGIFSANLWAITQTLAGPRAAGKWTGLQNGVGNLAGVVAPWLTGWLVGLTGRFYPAFLVAALIALAGAAVFVFGIGPVAPVDFKPRAAAQPRSL
jgi:MFS transporter, ACS family, D-galactonate transporter